MARGRKRPACFIDLNDIFTKKSKNKSNNKKNNNGESSFIDFFDFGDSDSDGGDD